MMRLACVLSFCLFSSCVAVQAERRLAESQQQLRGEGTLASIANADITASGDDLLIHSRDRGAPVEMDFKGCQGLGVEREHDQWWVLPISAAGR